MINNIIGYDLNTFLEKRGVTLSDYGSSESGLSRPDAILFLDLIYKAGKSPLGIEIWRHRGSKYFIDSLAGWYSESDDPEINSKSVRAFISTLDISKDDVMTIQFH